MSAGFDAAVGLRDRGRYAEAEAAVRGWIAGRPDDLEALALLAQLELLQGKPSAAETHRAMVAIDAAAAPSQRTLARLLAAARAAVRAGPADAANALVLSAMLSGAGQAEEAEALARQVLAADAASAEAHVALAQIAARRGRHREAAEACEAALALKPGLPLRRLLGSLRMAAGDTAAAAEAYRAALEADPNDLRALIDLAELELRVGRLAEAEALGRRAVALAPRSREAVGQLVLVLVDANRPDDAKAVLEQAAKADPKAAWPWVEQGRLVFKTERGGADPYFRRALEIAPSDADAAIALAQILAAPGRPDEAASLQEAVELVLGVTGDIPEAGRPVAAQVLWNTGHFAEADAIAPFSDLGRHAARNGRASAFQQQFPKVRTDADRLELLHQHRMWGEIVGRARAARPIERPPPRARRDVIRLGFLSSDLRNHVVALFAQPLFEHRDPRFELYCYSSYPRAPDDVAQWIARRSAAFRRLPGNDREAAQVIAGDDLDLLLELGGPTHMNRAGVVAYKPARRVGSWLGYPHSLGLAAIDYFVADPYLVPPRAELLLEQPLLMPASWICMAPAAFPDPPYPASAPPLTRTGHITFGTANSTYKFNPRLLQAWARVLAAVPGSRFLIVRPEVGAPAVRANIARAFAAEGVDADRLEFRAQRGQIRPLYDEMDIALDTFPLTGGTTTCDALWMGVPTVSLVGEAVFERLSWSILSNAGLADLCATSVDDFVRLAVELAGRPERIAELKRTMRERITSRPLGQPERFAHDFYDLMAGAVAG